jgi:hypothetical protein
VGMYRLEHKTQINAEVKNAWMLSPFNNAFSTAYRVKQKHKCMNYKVHAILKYSWPSARQFSRTEENHKNCN